MSSVEQQRAAEAEKARILAQKIGVAVNGTTTQASPTHEIVKDGQGHKIAVPVHVKGDKPGWELVPCPVPGCKKGPFVKGQGLSRHLAWHNSKVGALRCSCPACKLTFPTVDELEQHAKEKHTPGAKKLWSIIEVGKQHVLSLPPAEPLLAKTEQAKVEPAPIAQHAARLLQTQSQSATEPETTPDMSMVSRVSRLPDAALDESGCGTGKAGSLGHVPEAREASVDHLAPLVAIGFAREKLANLLDYDIYHTSTMAGRITHVQVNFIDRTREEQDVP